MRKIEKQEIKKASPGKLMDAKRWVDPMCGLMVTGK